MTARLVALGIIAVTLAGHAAENATWPFATVVRRGDALIATLPRIGMRYLISSDRTPRVTAYGESFELRDGASLSLDWRHGSYRVTCHLIPAPAGLQVESQF